MPSTPSRPRDRARDLVADDRRQLRRVRVEAGARHRVGEVDAGGGDLDADVAGPQLRVGALLHLQDAGVPVLGDDDGAHGGGP